MHPSRTLLALASLLAVSALRLTADVDQLQKSFLEPPNDAKPMVRWWWFGPSVVKPQLEREMNFMKEGGFGGFEVQSTYPLAVDDQYPGFKNYKFMSPEYLDAITFTAAKAKELGLRMDLTLGSGWPYGGPMITREEAVQSIGNGGIVDVAPGQTSVAPAAGAGGRRGGAAGGGAPNIIAALLGPVTDAAPGDSPYLPLKIENGAAQLPANLHGATQVHFFVYAQAGLMQVKRPALGAEGFIVDHYSPTSIAKFIREIATPQINATGANPPYAVFCDSLEVSGEGWTPNFLAEFKQRRGYDLEPLLPALFDANFPNAAAIRADYGKTVAEAFNDNFVNTFTKFAADHKTLFRIQPYGTPPTTLTTYARANLDEGENGQTMDWKGFHALRWASSASHLLGRPVTSSEAFTWLHSAVFLGNPLDLKAASSVHFLQGINQFIEHGWAYTAPGVEYPGWRFYAAAVFNEKNPWWVVMPDVNRYLQRVSHMMRQGTSANDIALYLPEEDAYTRFTPTSLEMASATGGLVGGAVSGIMPQLLDSGYNLDFVDDGILALRGQASGSTLAFGDVKFKVVILPNVTRIPLATYKKFEEFANGGGILVAYGDLPSLAPGYKATEADHQAIRDISQRLFSAPGAKGIYLQTADQLGAALIAKLRPDVSYSVAQPDVGFVHRHTDGGEVYFVANTSNQPHSATAFFRVTGMNPEWWNPVTGEITPAKVEQRYSDATAVNLDLAPYGTQLLVFTNRSLATPAAAPATLPPTMDLSQGWQVTFKNASAEPDPAPAQMNAPSSWTDDSAKEFFSGTATYEKQITVPAAMLQPGVALRLDFGTGQATQGGGRGGIAAAYESPVREAAAVYVNGQPAGAVWCPPFNVDVTKLLKPGANQIKIVVGNLAGNYMAGHPQMDLTQLRSVYGNRFDPQNMNLIKSQPSGLMAPVQLVAGPAN